MEFVKSYMPYKLEMVGTANSRTWRTDPIIVNAYNYFSDNAISTKTPLSNKIKQFMLLSDFYRRSYGNTLLSCIQFRTGVRQKLN